MERIRLLTQQIHLHSSSAANVISHGENSEVIQFLPKNLIPLKEITAKARGLCNDMEAELETWFAMTSELLEASIETHSLSEDQKKEAKERYREVLSEMQAAAEEKEMLQEELDDLERYKFHIASNYADTITSQLFKY